MRVMGFGSFPITGQTGWSRDTELLGQVSDHDTWYRSRLRKESGRFRGVRPLSWLAALQGGKPDTSAGRCSPILRRALGFVSAIADAPHAGSSPSAAFSPSVCSPLD